MTERVKIRTSNPEALRGTLLSLPGGHHEVLMSTYADGVVEVETNNQDFLIFACQNQGYGEVVNRS